MLKAMVKGGRAGEGEDYHELCIGRIPFVCVVLGGGSLLILFRKVDIASSIKVSFAKYEIAKPSEHI